MISGYVLSYKPLTISAFFHSNLVVQDIYQNNDPHLWTIPTEFRCSMLLFLIQCGVSRLHMAFRFTVIAGTVLSCAYTDSAHFASFTAGKLLAHVDVVARSHRAMPPELAVAKDVSGPIGQRWRVGWMGLF